MLTVMAAPSDDSVEMSHATVPRAPVHVAMPSLYAVRAEKRTLDESAFPYLFTWEAKRAEGKGNCALLALNGIFAKLFQIKGMRERFLSLHKAHPTWLRLAIDGTDATVKETVIVCSFSFCDPTGRMKPKFREFLVGLAVGKFARFPNIELLTF